MHDPGPRQRRHRVRPGAPDGTETKRGHRPEVWAVGSTMDLERFPSLSGIAATSPDTWLDRDVPLAQRGVRVSWLVGLVRDLLEDINRPREQAGKEAEEANYHNRAGLYGMHDQPDGRSR